ncbi:hypothetical protein [Polyangium spumosum]|uniref:Uncharacterized protein n=1 Tax=Polyangium spumosum TaxID=889282 RepID=A0A6N7PQ02_9BACT|nr:hypothetical protein [Polyangium spumosum]MRG92164.1 hypothetical protein [Polyangium spumosum]
MKRATIVRGIEAAAEKRRVRLQPVPKPAPRPALFTAEIHEIHDDGVTLGIGLTLERAKLHPSVHKAVVEGARARHERVLVEEGEGGALVVLGALRTQPTPGVDAAETYTIQAKRITLEAGEELSLSAQTAAVVLRAIGEVETYAERILSRAEGVHKIVGRMLRLN